MLVNPAKVAWQYTQKLPPKFRKISYFWEPFYSRLPLKTWHAYQYPTVFLYYTEVPNSNHSPSWQFWCPPSLGLNPKWRLCDRGCMRIEIKVKYLHFPTVNGRIRFILVTAVCVSSSMLTVSMSIFVSFGMHCFTGVTFPKITRFLVSLQDNPAWHVRSSFS